MIVSFKHKGLKRWFIDDHAAGLPTLYKDRISRWLDRLDASVKPEDMNLPGFRFHALKGDRQGEYAVSISANWRLTFRGGGLHLFGGLETEEVLCVLFVDGLLRRS